MSEALEMARKLGIKESHLKAALLLYRKARVAALTNRLDPRASRIAILYIEEVDRHLAQQKLTFKELNQLREIAHKLYEETAQKLLY